MAPTTDEEQPRPTSEPPKPAATFFTILFTLALFVNIWFDSQSTDYNGVQNSLILAALAVAPPGIRVGASLATVLMRVLERVSGGDRR